MTKSKLYSNFAIPDSLNTSKKTSIRDLLAWSWGLACQQKGISKFQIKVSKGANSMESVTKIPFPPMHHSLPFISIQSKKPLIPCNTTNTKESHDSNNDTSSDDSSAADDEVLVEQDKQESSTTKLSPYHAKNYFNSTMGGKDLQVLLPWPLVALPMIFPTTRMHHFRRQRHTILK